MKKLIGLFMVLLITSNVLAQTVGADLGEFFPYKYFEYSLTYRFTKNDKEYAVAYEMIPRDSMGMKRTYLLGSNDILKRNLYLYRNDGDKWTIVSDIIKVDYWKIENGIQSYDYYCDNPQSSIERKCDLNELLGDIGGYSSIELNEEILKIRMLNFCGIVGVDDEYNCRWDIISLVSNDNGTFSVLNLR